MKKISFLTIGILITFLLILSCSKTEDKTIELYGDYLSIELNSINENFHDSIYEVKISNSKDLEFENECTLIFELVNPNSESLVLTSEENIINKRIPNNPSLGFLNIQNGGNYSKNYNLNELNWSGENLEQLQKVNYNLTVTLFINDPSSPTNRLTSNKLVYQRE
jgi:hypothetical protein